MAYLLILNLTFVFLLINLVEVWRGQAAPELVSRWHSSWRPCSSFRLLSID
jgi:hypothetical protein